MKRRRSLRVLSVALVLTIVVMTVYVFQRDLVTAWLRRNSRSSLTDIRLFENLWGQTNFNKKCSLNRQDVASNKAVQTEEMKSAMLQCGVWTRSAEPEGTGLCSRRPKGFGYPMPLVDFESLSDQWDMKGPANKSSHHKVSEVSWCGLSLLYVKSGCGNCEQFAYGAQLLVQGRGFRHYPQLVSVCVTETKKLKMAKYAIHLPSDIKSITDFKLLMRNVENRNILSRAQLWSIRVHIALDYAHALADLHNSLPKQSNFANLRMVYCNHTRENIVISPNLEVMLTDLENIRIHEKKYPPVLCFMTKKTTSEKRQVIQQTGSRGFDGRYDSLYLGRFLYKDILVHPPPSALVRVTDMISGLTDPNYDNRIYAIDALCVLQALSQEAPMTTETRQILKDNWADIK